MWIATIAAGDTELGHACGSYRLQPARCFRKGVIHYIISAPTAVSSKTSCCQAWTEDLVRQNGWAPEVA
jgi:hypothetical protein